MFNTIRTFLAPPTFPDDEDKSRAAGQQLTGVEQLALAMQNIHQITEQSLASTRQTERAAGELNRLAVSLREMVAQP